MSRDAVNQLFSRFLARTGGTRLKPLSISLLLMTLMSLAPTAVYAQSANPVEGHPPLGTVRRAAGLTVSTGVDSNVLAEETNPK